MPSSANNHEKQRVLQAFKLACLRYQPSKVPHEGQSYERKDLIEKISEKVSDSKTSSETQPILIPKPQETREKEVPTAYIDIKTKTLLAKSNKHYHTPPPETSR